ncbi:hypothetical protein K504DRAFT_33406 [Pleomassaria siparia CBS 279.74]|uniref:Secreted protein n=1 Tax=Pleomassaria siparia CBS 279.74 TaxID=1314801 RepID=A0A6G1KSD3_9PLEO|nr:hypothetical protein K504DRAFT_33406 [Pleomassaria siparia CBS 279.74]
MLPARRRPCSLRSCCLLVCLHNTYYACLPCLWSARRFIYTSVKPPNCQTAKLPNCETAKLRNCTSLHLHLLHLRRCLLFTRDLALPVTLLIYRPGCTATRGDVRINARDASLNSPIICPLNDNSFASNK